MVTVSKFQGVSIILWINDHGEPHFHARYAEYEFVVALNPVRITEGSAPRRIEKLVLEWAKLRRHEMLENWYRLRRDEPARKVDP